MVKLLLEPSGTGGKVLKRKIMAFFGALGMSMCLTCLYLGMRKVMDLGGFVARGGPYAIAHPAPDWTWIMPASIFAGIFFLVLYVMNSDFLGGLNLGFLAWPALFLSLGWNFLEYALLKNRVAWAWLFCGLLFLLMGGLPLWGFMRTAFRERRLRLESAGMRNIKDIQEEKKPPLVPLFISLLAVFTGVIFGIWLFSAITAR